MVYQYKRNSKEQDELDEAKKTHPHLNSDESVSSHARAGKNARILLKRAFPKTKFSIKTSAYSGGSSLRVSWVGVKESPTEDEVSPIISSFEQGVFNGMDDSYSYNQVGRGFRDAFGGVRHVFSDRSRLTPEEEARHDAADLDVELPSAPSHRRRRF